MSTYTYRIAAGGAAWMLLLTGPVFAARGDLDPAFGLGGRVTFDITPYAEEASAIAQQGDRLLVGRNVVNFPLGETFSVVRLNTNGTPDGTFGGGDGVATAELAAKLRGITYAVRPLVNGKIIAAGYISNENGFELRHGLVRYLPDGAIDPSFGVDGVVSGNVSTTYRWIRAVVEQPDGRLIVAGGIVDGEAQADLWIGRLNADGSPDTAFGDDGIFRIDFFDAEARDAVQALALQTDGSIVAAGYAVDGNAVRHMVMLRLTSQGTRDATFGDGGSVAIAAPDPWWSANVGMQQQDDGKLVIGTQSYDEILEQCDMLVARYTRDGQSDPAFGSDGLARWSLGPCWGNGNASLVTEPGGGVVVGFVGANPADVLVQRLTTDGVRDMTFGINGTATVETGVGWGSWTSRESGVPLVRLSDGKLALAASEYFDWEGGGEFFVVARLLESGGSPGWIGLESTYSYLDEDSGSAQFTVRRTGGTQGVVNVSYGISSSEAVGTPNFESVRGTLTWADGDAASQTITLPIVDDNVWEGSESLNLSLFDAVGGAVLMTRNAFVYIVENDPAPPPQPMPPNPGNAGSGEIRRGGGALSLETLLALGLTLVITSRRRQKRSAAQ